MENPFPTIAEPRVTRLEQPSQPDGVESADQSLATEETEAAEPKKPTALERAKAALAQSEAPALSAHEICTTLVKVAKANQLPIGFLTNLIWQESRFDRTAISRVGAMGIAQFMPDVADNLSVDAFDARDALPASGQLLRTLSARFRNLGLVAAAYNAGPKRVADWLEQRAGLPKETRDYVSIVTGRPAEHWRANAPTVVFNVPRQVPCHGSAAFASMEQAERAAQLEKLAEEKKLAEKKAADAKREAAQAARKIASAAGRRGLLKRVTQAKRLRIAGRS
jgi:hypothetical protein